MVTHLLPPHVYRFGFILRVYCAFHLPFPSWFFFFLDYARVTVRLWLFCCICGYTIASRLRLPRVCVWFPTRLPLVYYVPVAHTGFITAAYTTPDYVGYGVRSRTFPRLYAPRFGCRLPYGLRCHVPRLCAPPRTLRLPFARYTFVYVTAFTLHTSSTPGLHFIYTPTDYPTADVCVYTLPLPFGLLPVFPRLLVLVTHAVTFAALPRVPHTRLQFTHIYFTLRFYTHFVAMQPACATRFRWTHTYAALRSYGFLPRPCTVVGSLRWLPLDVTPVTFTRLRLWFTCVRYTGCHGFTAHGCGCRIFHILVCTFTGYPPRAYLRGYTRYRLFICTLRWFTHYLTILFTHFTRLLHPFDSDYLTPFFPTFAFGPAVYYLYLLHVARVRSTPRFPHTRLAVCCPPHYTLLRLPGLHVYCRILFCAANAVCCWFARVRV